MLALTDPVEEVCSQALANALRRHGVRTISGLLALTPNDWLELPEPTYFFSDIGPDAVGSRRGVTARLIAARRRDLQMLWEIEDLNLARADVVLELGHRWFDRVPALGSDVTVQGLVTQAEEPPLHRLTLLQPTIVEGLYEGDPTPYVAGAIPLYPKLADVSPPDLVDAIQLALERLPDGSGPDPGYQVGDFGRLASQFRRWALVAHFGSAHWRSLGSPEPAASFRKALRALDAARPRLPEPRLIKTPTDAEELARDTLRACGFPDARTTGVGRDGGVDVRSAAVVAQVKLEGLKTDAPRVQALFGVAAHENRQPAFFSLGGYTQAALEWSEAAGVALFEFDYSGGVAARSSAAKRLLVGATTPDPQTSRGDGPVVGPSGT